MIIMMMMIRGINWCPSGYIVRRWGYGAYIFNPLTPNDL
jgi:hypothetical protein